MNVMPKADDRDVIQAIDSAALAAVRELSIQFPGGEAGIGTNFEYHLSEVIKEMLQGNAVKQGCAWGAGLSRLIAGSEQASEGHAVEIQQLRELIPHAAHVGAVQTTISVELLAVLLASHDKSTS